MSRRIGYFSHPSFLEHDTGFGHPESPLRLDAIQRLLDMNGVTQRLILREPGPASRSAIGLVHSPQYISRIERACRQGPTDLDPDTTASRGSWDAALHAVGAVIQAVDEVCFGSLDAAFCAVRPPGHHALAERAMGFCLFNNIAIAARHAQERWDMRRILIVDWDVHHGNGTQDIFYDDDSVLYFSTHQGAFYPGTGDAQERGEGSGSDHTLNVPLRHGSGDEEVIRAFSEYLAPAAERFQPELVLVSAGFDAHAADPLAGLMVTEGGYAELTRIVRRIAQTHALGRLVSVLEGGYALDALAASVQAHLNALLEP